MSFKRCAGDRKVAACVRVPAIAGALFTSFVIAGMAPARAYDGEEWFRFGGNPAPAPGYSQSHGAPSGRESHDQRSRSRDAMADQAANQPAHNQSTDAALSKQWEMNPPRGYATLSKDNIGPMKTAAKRYTDIVAQGGWKMLPPYEMAAGTTHQAVVLLRQRLESEGDLRPGGGHDDQLFDQYVERAVKRFQVRHGLTPNGQLSKRTLAAMNVPAAVRLRQVKANLERLVSLASSTPKRYVVVNIPAAQIEAVENDQVVSRHAAVVGKLDRQTPILKSAIHELNFNPVWHLPPTVIDKDLVPKGQEMARSGKSVLTKFGIDAYDGSGRKLDPNRIDWSSASAKNLSFKQNPGAENPLGFVKINFNNSYSVYMHDTPSQNLFGSNFRAASSGCVRVQNIQQLASWILGENEGWNRQRIDQMQRSGERLDVKVKHPVTLIFAYITSWATEDGMVHFRRDLYQRDGVGLTASAY